MKLIRKGMEKPSKAAPYFMNLSVENVKCFGDVQRINLCDNKGRPRQWTVILGDNGVGKTTLLEVLGSGFKVMNDAFYDLAEEAIGYSIGWPNNRFAIKINANVAKLEYCIGFVIPGNENASIQTITVDASYSGGKDVSFGRLGIKADRNEVKKLGLKFSAIAAYGATRQVYQSSSSTGEIRKDSVAHLFNDAQPLVNPEDWFAAEEHASLIEKGSSWRLEKVKSILKEILEVKDIRTVAHRNNKIVSVVVENDFGEIGIHELSLGQKTLMAWLVDLARWMFEWYPESENPLAEPVVVLVDEIDLHLHPAFQRRLVGRLTKLFPNAQFIVTAHSPLIVQSLEDANVVLLKKEGDHVVIDQKEESYEGWRIDQLLSSDLYYGMSLFSEVAQQKLARHKTLSLKGQRSISEEEELAELDAEVKSWPVGETEEDRRASELIRKAAAILKNAGKG
jgi:predicted ATP-binding protein involved in virulence